MRYLGCTASTRKEKQMDLQARSVSRAPLHPALWVAALSLTAFSAVGIAAMTGVLERTPASVSAPVMTPAATIAPSAVAGLSAPGGVVTEGEKQSGQTPVVTASKPAAAGKPVTVRQSPKVEPPVRLAEARPVRVAQQTYDSGIDVIPAQPQPARDSALETQGRDQAEATPAGDAYRLTPACLDCGVIESVREVRAAADPSGLGAAAGGVVGGLLGNNVGKGSGRTIATLIGIAGGAYAGHQIEKTQRTTTRHEVGVRMDNGEYRTVALDTMPTWQVGDKVHLRDGTILPAR